jgi:hypothetical protein
MKHKIIIRLQLKTNKVLLLGYFFFNENSWTIRLSFCVASRPASQAQRLSLDLKHAPI